MLVEIKAKWETKNSHLQDWMEMLLFVVSPWSHSPPLEWILTLSWDQITFNCNFDLRFGLKHVIIHHLVKVWSVGPWKRRMPYFKQCLLQSFTKTLRLENLGFSSWWNLIQPELKNLWKNFQKWKWHPVDRVLKRIFFFDRNKESEGCFAP